ncbi:FAD-dependent oxidoreductase [Aquipuribacter hungaricus]|uniref:FAD-dependent oxidoreductase n=1 Tax=Aquipuribacter hungaricus TaxID=545624 RepID=A0ABV7WGB9_9MICO
MSTTPGPLLRADVCVVGAGPAGLTVAHELAGTGLRVLVLEAGPAAPPPGGVDVPSTRSVGLPYDPATTRSAGVGGSSLRWDIETPAGPDHVRLKELDPLDLEDRGARSGPGWPLTWDELAPHYRRARELFGLAPADPGRDAPVRGRLERRSYSFGRSAVFTTEVPALLAAHPHVTLLAGWTVTEAVPSPGGGQVARLRCWSEEHGATTVEARAYVLAGGGIENARLLLASRAGSPAGLGNDHDQVGRHFMEHPHYLAGVVVPSRGRDLTLASRRWDLVSRAGRPAQDKYALAPALVRRHGLLNAAYKVQLHTGATAPGFGHDGRVGQPVVDAYAALRAAVRLRDPSGVTPLELARLAAATPELARRAYRQVGAGRAGGAGRTVGHTSFRVRVMGEQEPSPSSRLTLAGTRDRLGVPEARLDWRLSETDVRSMVQGQHLVAEDLGSLLGGRVVTLLGRDGEPRPLGGAHHMGTTRMSTRPRDGVVDRDCRVHGVRNLFVAGSSVFPTGGAANPTLTVVALAARLARDLARELTTPAGREAPAPVASAAATPATTSAEPAASTVLAPAG